MERSRADAALPSFLPKQTASCFILFAPLLPAEERESEEDYESKCSRLSATVTTEQSRGSSGCFGRPISVGAEKKSSYCAKRSLCKLEANTVTKIEPENAVPDSRQQRVKCLRALLILATLPLPRPRSFTKAVMKHEYHALYLLSMMIIIPLKVYVEPSDHSSNT